MSHKPLTGVKVLDFSQLLPGPMCSLQLADLGAEVIKIEPPQGDAARGLGSSSSNTTSHFFLAINRNKRSLAIDLRAEGAVAIIEALVKDADILLEGFRPGVMNRLGLGYERLAALNPRLVYCAISGYGQDGPLAEFGGHDINYQSYAGTLEQNATADGPPHTGSFPVADLAGGALSATMGILAALFDVQRSGRGRFIDVAMTDCAMALNTIPLTSLHSWGQPVPAGCDTLSGALPCYGTYVTADGRYLAVGALEPKFWQAFCTAVGHPELMKSGWAAGKAGAAIKQQVADIIKAKTQAEWVEVFRAVDACVSPVLRIDEVLAHPNTQARRMTVNTAGADGRTVPYFAFPLKMSDYQFSVDRLPPALGADNEDILRELGHDQAAIASLRNAGVI